MRDLQFHDEVDFVPIFEGLEQLDDVGMLEFSKHLDLVFQGILFTLERLFVDAFHCVHLARSFSTLSQHHLRERTAEKMKIALNVSVSLHSSVI